MRRHLFTRAGIIRTVAFILAVTAIAANLPQAVPTAQAISANLVISQVYGAGGNSGATLNADYIELFNRGNASASLDGLSIQYASATGTGFFAANTLALSGSVAPGQYFLIRMVPGSNGAAVPTPDATGTISMAAAAGKVILANTATGLNCNGSAGQPCSADQLAQIIDLVGFGATNFSEGGSPTGATSTILAAFRKDGGCTDTDVNGADFVTAAPAPRNTSSTLAPCGPVSETATPTITVTPVNTNTPTITLTPSTTPSGDTPTPTVTNTATVTITPTATNTPGPITRIHTIQGAAHLSLYHGQAVTSVPGIVTALKNDGFYLQDPDPDADDATSEAIFVFTSSAPTVAVGNSVLVNGNVTEFRFASAPNNLTLTEITNPSITLVAASVPLPTPVVLGNGGRTIPTSVISNDTVGGTVDNPGTLFDPAQDGIDFYESLESMRVQVNNAVVTGPSNSFNEIWVLADNGTNATGRSARGGVIVSAGDFNPERIQIDDVLTSGSPDVSTGDRFNGPIVGVMEFDFGNWELRNTQALPSVTTGVNSREATSLTGAVDYMTIGTFHVENLAGNEGPAKYNALAAAIVTNLGSPDILNLEEIQDNNGTTNNGTVDATDTLNRLAAAVVSAGGPSYQYRQINPVDGADGGAPGGNIRVGFFFNPARVQFVDRPGGTSTAATTVNNVGGVPQLSFSPGRVDPTNTAFNASRKPLVGEFVFNGRTVFVIANHFNSKGGDQPLFGQFQPPTLTTEPQRMAQANVLRTFVQSILAIDANALIVAAGDFNDFEFSPPLQVLANGGLNSFVTTLPANQRYSYVFEGNSQTLDHILGSPSAFAALDEFDIVHMNAEFFDQISDHDPSVARFNISAVPTVTPTSSTTPSPTVTETPTATPTATVTNTPTNTPVPPTTTPTNTPTNTPVPPTTTPTSTPVPAGAIELRLEAGLLPNNRALRYDPPGPGAVQVQTFNGEPGCGRFEASPNLMQVTGTASNGQSRNLCMLLLRMGVDKGPNPGPLDNFRVNQGEKVTFALGNSPTVAGKKIRTAQIKIESNPQTTVRLTAYNGTTVIGTRVIAVSSLTPQGAGVQGNNYSLVVDPGQTFTRLDVETTAGSFSIVGGSNNSGPTIFNLSN